MEASMSRPAPSRGPIRPSAERVAIVALAITSAVAARLIAARVLDDVPHVMDEMAYLLEAKRMAAGHLTAPLALPRAAFNMWFVDDRVARFGIFPPGWPAALALGIRLGLERWTNPLLHLVTVLVVGRAGARIGGSRVGLLAAALYATSPQVVLLAASLMSHSLVALGASVVTLAIAELLDEGADRRPALFLWSGAALGAVFATRPLCGVALLVPFVALGVRARRPSGLLLTVMTAAPFLAALAAFNRALTGSALRFPQTAYFDGHAAPANVPFFTYGKGCNALGFGAACDHTVRGAVHTVSSAISDAGDNLTALLLLAASPVVLVAAMAAVLRSRTRAAWLLSVPLIAIGLYGLYWQAGVCYGARFYQAGIPALMVAAALGIDRSAPRRLPPRRFASAVLAAALLCNVGGFALALREMRSWSFWGTDDRFAELARRWNDGRAVVMVAFGPSDVKNPKLVATGSMREGTWLLGVRALAALGQNAPVVDDGEIVFAKFHPALVPELAARFPDRKLWLYTAWANRTQDDLRPWTTDMFADHVYRRPADNFDGFRVAPPDPLPPPLLREVTDEGWPPRP